MRYGAIYIAHNPRDGENLYKVGKTERLIEQRMRELTADTSNLGSYTAKAYFIVAGVDEAERECHKRLARYRVQSNREFFEIPFERLATIINEVLEPFFATSNCPQIDDNQPKNNASSLDPKQKLEEIRKNNQSKEEVWNSELNEAREAIKKWFGFLINRSIEAKQNLKNEPSLFWVIPSKFNSEDKYGRFQPYCSVTLRAQFKEKPAILTLSGVRGGLYGDIDLSRSISEPDIWHKDEDKEFIRWKENDDGRFGKIEISPIIENSSTYDMEQGRSPKPKISVCAARIEYDDYHQHYEDKYRREKIFSDPEEAFEVFTAAVISNIAEQQFDIRKESDTYRTKYGEERTKIKDYGKFILDVLDDDEESLGLDNIFK